MTSVVVDVKQQLVVVLAFRPVLFNEIKKCYKLESSSYPVDEAASLESLKYRQLYVGYAFIGAYLVPEDKLIGYICSTQCSSFDDANVMSTHDPNGHILAIHSVVVDEQYRRKGYATQMLINYIKHIQSLSSDYNIRTIMLLSKSKLLPLYIKCGFKVNRPSPIVHGKELWYECEYKLETKNDENGSNNNIPYWIVDAFTTEPGCGNPAAVVDMSSVEESASSLKAKSIEWKQMCSKEFNLAETAFVWKHKQKHTSSRSDDDSTHSHYDIRYYTNTGIEIPLCGHATLASATVLFNEHNALQKITFHTMNDSIKLLIERQQQTDDQTATRTTSIIKSSMIFPWKDLIEFPKDSDPYLDGLKMLKSSLQIDPSDIIFMGVGAHDGEDMFVHITEQAFTEKMYPPGTSDINYNTMIQSTLYQRGLCICCARTSSDDNDVDFYSRFFGPKVGIFEDPVTGSAHCLLAPYFGNLLQKTKLIGKQMSTRKGIIECVLLLKEQKQVVQITGSAILFMKGTLYV